MISPLRILPKTLYSVASMIVNNFDFTNSSNSLGAIYIVRDPRNVITSIKNHYDLDDDKAIKWMTNKNIYLFE